MKRIHHELKDFLIAFGLTPTEVSLYTTALQFGSLTAGTLAKRAGIKRTTTQSALISLVEKGMMSVHVQSGTNYYTASDPSLIEHRFSEQIDDLKKQQLDFINLLPLFDTLTNKSALATEVAHYQGVSGVRTAVDTALFCASRRWKIIAPERNFFSEGNSDYADYFIKIRKQRGIKAQSLWEPAFTKNRKFDAVAFEFRNPRILPKKLVGKFKNTIIIFDSSVVFVSSAAESSAVLIKSSEIHQTMEVFFDGLWQASSNIPKRNIQ